MSEVKETTVHATENTENSEKSNGLSILEIHKQDIVGLANKTKRISKKVLEGLADLLLGRNCSAAVDSIHEFTDELLFGTVYDFLQENKRFKGLQHQEGLQYRDADRFMNSNEGMTREDFIASCEAIKMFTGEGYAIFNNVYHYLEEMLARGRMNLAFSIVRRDLIIREGNYGDKLVTLQEGIYEYGKIMERYKKSSIYNEIPVSKKELEYAENLILVEGSLDKDFRSSACLNKLFPDGYERPNAGWVNFAYLVDQDTKYLTALPEISVFADEIALIAQLDNEVKSYFGSGSEQKTVWMVVHDVLDYIRTIFKETRDILNNYRYNTQEFPYSIMHYTDPVKRAVEGTMGISLRDPAKSGTMYVDILYTMAQKSRKIADQVASNAP